MSEDIHYSNQRIYCENNNLPFFSSRNCNHDYDWNTERDNYGNLQTLGESLVERYGEEEAFKISSGTHILSCPGCNRSWCD